ncbi:YidH family protein [Thermostaphylospora chromogena]|uniref:Uncharacterized membrane protein YidH, DUF202 family n=1 Tax=Thermostaphylospora chromogena TaxID=35622 RepID=A0A1H1HUG7_9ACTN|nr:DUF202 domain-containing protein [Thermostaphylospora chromogena]SDR29102.1 Uncharacterized membrane protein YidH, DUF202 family [Thermostaphylospora chromogena]
MTVSPEPWDPGLQSERTRLAWVRTATLLSIGGLGAAKLGLQSGLPAPVNVAFALAALCGGVLLARTGSRYMRVQYALHESRPLDNRLDALLAWLGTLAVAVGAFVLIVIG